MVASVTLSEDPNLTMSERKTCPNGRRECGFEEDDEFALAGNILGMIGNYTKGNEAYTCPTCLRNAMMALAALLHLEAAKMDETGCGQSLGELGFVDAFTEAARERMISVMDAFMDGNIVLGKRRLM